MSRATAGSGRQRRQSRQRRVSSSEPIYGEIHDFLVDEAALLDDDQFTEWLTMLADDVVYRMPIRGTVHRRDGDGFDQRNFHYDDDLRSLTLRARRSGDIESAFDRDPPPRIRRLVTNLVVHEADVADEYCATTYLTVLRNRFDASAFELLTAKREDTLRRTPEGLVLARRTILLDQARVSAAFLNVLL